MCCWVLRYSEIQAHFSGIQLCVRTVGPESLFVEERVVSRSGRVGDGGVLTGGVKRFCMYITVCNLLLIAFYLCILLMMAFYLCMLLQGLLSSCVLLLGIFYFSLCESLCVTLLCEKCYVWSICRKSIGNNCLCLFSMTVNQTYLVVWTHKKLFQYVYLHYEDISLFADIL